VPPGQAIEIMRLLVALALANYHLDGDLDPDWAPEGRQYDAAPATPPTSLPCHAVYCIL
jgi:hypothetical protein